MSSHPSHLPFSMHSHSSSTHSSRDNKAQHNTAVHTPLPPSHPSPASPTIHTYNQIYPYTAPHLFHMHTTPPSTPQSTLPTSIRADTPPRTQTPHATSPRIPPPPPSRPHTHGILTSSAQGPIHLNPSHPSVNSTSTATSTSVTSTPTTVSPKARPFLPSFHPSTFQVPKVSQPRKVRAGVLTRLNPCSALLCSALSCSARFPCLEGIVSAHPFVARLV